MRTLLVLCLLLCAVGLALPAQADSLTLTPVPATPKLAVGDAWQLTSDYTITTVKPNQAWRYGLDSHYQVQAVKGDRKVTGHASLVFTDATGVYQVSVSSNDVTSSLMGVVRPYSVSQGYLWVPLLDVAAGESGTIVADLVRVN